MSSRSGGSAMSHQLLRLARLLLLQVLCVRPTASLTMTGCSSGYGIVAPSPYTVYYKESSYCQLLYYSSSYLDWNAAKTACGQLSGGTLATIDNADVNTLVASVSGSSMWIGLNDISSEGHWVWVDGTPFSYNNWCLVPLEPDNVGSIQHCVLTNYAFSGAWDDDFCT